MFNMRLEKIAKGRWAILAGLMIFSFMATSYGKSNNKTLEPQLCAASWAELKSHAKAGGACTSKKLENKIGGLVGQWSAPIIGKIDFKIPDNEFYIKFNGKMKKGPICCSAKGIWSIQGFGAIAQGAENGRQFLKIGKVKFFKADVNADSGDVYEPYQTTELQVENSGTGIN